MNIDNWLTRHIYAAPALIMLVILFALNIYASPSFLLPQNWAALAISATPFVLLSIGQAAPIMSGGGGLDLSNGPLAGFVNAIIAAVLVPQGFSDPFTVTCIALGVGLLAGIVNGLIVTKLRVQPIIGTLATYLICQGATLEVLPMAGGSAPDWMAALMGSYFGIPGMLILVVAVGCLWLLLQRTAFRRNLLATGGDFVGTFTTGVDVDSIRIASYVISGLVAALTGIVFTATLGSADPSVGTPFTLISIAAVALGGGSLAGGNGGMLGPAAAGLALYLIESLFTAAQISVFYLQICYGAVLILALALNASMEHFRIRSLASRQPA